MLITIFFITLLLGIICWYIGCDGDFEGLMIFGLVNFAVCFIALIYTIITTTDVIDSRTLSYEIKMYQEENNKIENDIDTLVKEYMQYETETFNNLKTEDSINVLVSLYPELKSNELVSRQIKIYNDNNEKIKQLKSQKIRSANKKWLLYFGGQKDLEKMKE